ncbi:BtrH N-terminal domain-containing protein [Mycobacterium paraterrae]|uniref:BtrH N-terminal domain-containing protein n=1 Tax=Mycobacterium paraterrae TaxID=577492 RepID=A0ABY3VN42_9MYCO|nr:BtrH N-terminal domain-containing protein [Mycobacterium paraterrae]UMB70032.1 BtrH N-terminal domain-containing protein [Mycobacterium paraterrae]
MSHIRYRHRMGGHCGSGALRDLTEWAGLGWGTDVPDEGLIFVLGGALDFLYIRSGTLMPRAYLVGRGGALEDQYLDRIGARFRLQSTDDPEIGWGWVIDEIDAGRPVMVWADIAELPYLRVRLNMSRHDIVITGYDDAQQMASVVDNDREATQLVPYEKLRRARSSTGFPVPTRHSTYLIDWPHTVPDMAAIGGPALADSAAQMRGESSQPSVIVVPDADVTGSGLSGVQIFVDDVRCWPELFDDDALGAALFGLGAFIEKAGTGGGLFRSLQARGCSTIADLLGAQAVAYAATAAADAARLWSAVAAAALDATVPLRDRCQAAADLAAGLPEAEHTLADALDAAARSLVAR